MLTLRRSTVPACWRWLLIATVAFSPLAFGHAASVQDRGVKADLTIEPLDLAALRQLDPVELWTRLDGAEYWAIPREAPDDYYADADLSSAAALRSWLHNRIDDHVVFPYTHSSRPGHSNHRVDVWDIVAIADAHPEHARDRVLDLYKNDTLDRQEAGLTRGRRYDREHSWPKSLGFPDQDNDNAAYSDCHHLFAAYQPYNASRSNKPYGEDVADPAVRKITEENLDRGGPLMDEPDSSNYSFRDRWQVWMGRRGDLARVMFYMDVRYDGGPNEPDLILTNDITQITMRNVWQSGGQAFMGLLPVLLKWHAEDPVDDLERRRNAVIFLFQGNRNPFVDHPEWVGPIFGGAPMPGASTPTGSAPVIWINEFHYDNVGADVGEFVEVCGTAGTSLEGWTLVGYNGSGGVVYRTIALAGVIPDQSGGFGAVAFNFTGLQNGEADGVALVDPTGRAVELISYEGRFTAADGPARGMVSVDVLVEEGADTPAGHSLQRRGQGRTGPEFQWHGPSAASPGAVNVGQSPG